MSWIFSAFHCYNSDIAQCCKTVWLQQKDGLYCKTRTGSLIIMSLLHSAQREHPISCHSVWAHGVIFSKMQPTVGTDLFITSLCDLMPTHCCTYTVCNVSQQFCYYLLGCRSGINDRQRDMNPACQLAYTHTHTDKTRLYRDSAVMPEWKMKSDSVCFFYIMLNG